MRILRAIVCCSIPVLWSLFLRRITKSMGRFHDDRGARRLVRTIADFAAVLLQTLLLADFPYD